MRFYEIFNHYLTELKTSPYEYTTRMYRNQAQPAMECVFKAGDGSQVIARIVYIVNSNTILLNFSRENQHRMTGTGDQFRILSTVLDFYQKNLKKSIDRLGATTLMFSAESNEPSRVKLYSKRAVPEISAIIGSEWKGPAITRSQFGAGSEVEYTWTRPEPEKPKEKYRSIRRPRKD